jgi:hypothetical protein
VTGVCTGNISNLRIVKGTAVYTANFIPPTQPLTNISGTSLLTCQNSTLIDNSTNNFAITSFGQAQPIAVTPFTQTFTSQTITGNGSTYFDGTGDYLSVPDNEAFNLAAGDWTIETWFNFPVIPTVGSVYTFASQWRSEPGPSLAWFAYLFNNAGTYQLYFSYSTTGTNQINLSFNLAGASSIVGWNHLAFVRSGNSFLMFLNGTQLGSSQSLNATIFNSTAPVWVGAQSANGTPQYFINGYLSNLRIVKGTAVYTANFTPPAVPLTAITNTSLLTCQTNQPNNNNVFLDSSTNNFLITRNGNTTQGS